MSRAHACCNNSGCASHRVMAQPNHLGRCTCRMAASTSSPAGLHCWPPNICTEEGTPSLPGYLGRCTCRMAASTSSPAGLHCWLRVQGVKGSRPSSSTSAKILK